MWSRSPLQPDSTRRYDESEHNGEEVMRRALALSAALALLIVSIAGAGQTRTYDTTLEVTWDAAVKSVRDVDFVLMESDRGEHIFTMRTKSKISHKRGLRMRVELTRSGGQTAVHVESIDPRKAEKAARHISNYLNALDQRLD